MARKVFISFRFSDGADLKEDLERLFDGDTHAINRSESEDRSKMTDDTIQKYLYSLLRETSITIAILTPNAINYKKDVYGEYDDWLYDEMRYSLEDREFNRTNGVIALYTDETKSDLIGNLTHKCSHCNDTKIIRSILEFDNLIRKNVMNVKDEHKHNKCVDLYDSDLDSYISLIHIDEFKKDVKKYLDICTNKRERVDQFKLIKRMVQ